MKRASRGVSILDLEAGGWTSSSDPSEAQAPKRKRPATCEQIRLHLSEVSSLVPSGRSIERRPSFVFRRCSSQSQLWSQLGSSHGALAVAGSSGDDWDEETPNPPKSQMTTAERAQMDSMANTVLDQHQEIASLKDRLHEAHEKIMRLGRELARVRRANREEH